MLPEFEQRSTQLQDPLDLRATPRVALQVPAQLYSTDLSGPLPGMTRDISICGACIATPAPFAIKSLQKVVFSLASGPLAIDAIGSWQHDVDNEDIILTGLQFEDPPPAALDTLWSMVFDSGRNLARFLYEHTQLFELGLEEAMGISQLSRFREVPEGRFIFRQDTQIDGEDSLFILIEGSVTLQVRARNAIEIEIERLGPGELFGGTPLLADLPHFESGVAATRVRLLEIDAKAFKYLRVTRPWLGYRLSQALLRRSTQHLQRVFARIRDEL